MTLKKLLVIAFAALAFGFVSAPHSEAGVSIGIGIGLPIGYGYRYAPGYYPHAYAPYGYYRPAVGVYVRPHYHWYRHRRVYCAHRHYRR